MSEEQTVQETDDELKEQQDAITLEVVAVNDGEDYSTIDDIKQAFPDNFAVKGNLKGKEIKVMCKRENVFDLLPEEMTVTDDNDPELSVKDIFMRYAGILIKTAVAPEFTMDDCNDLPAGFIIDLGRKIMQEINPRVLDDFREDLTLSTDDIVEAIKTMING